MVPGTFLWMPRYVTHSTTNLKVSKKRNYYLIFQVGERAATISIIGAKNVNVSLEPASRVYLSLPNAKDASEYFRIQPLKNTQDKFSVVLAKALLQDFSEDTNLGMTIHAESASFPVTEEIHINLLPPAGGKDKGM